MFTPLTHRVSMPVFHQDKFREQFTRALLVQGKAKKTAKIYSDAVIAFHHFSHVHPLFAKANDIRAFLYYLLREKKYAPRTFNQNLYGLKAFYGTYMPEIPMLAAMPFALKTHYNKESRAKPALCTTGFFAKSKQPRRQSGIRWISDQILCVVQFVNLN